MSELLSVDHALARILEGVKPVSAEPVCLSKAGQRVLAEDVAALRSQPPFPASAMDGYAVRAQDISTVPVNLTQIGESAAGHGCAVQVKKGECVRIFTGAPLPEGADTIVIQENTHVIPEDKQVDGADITILQSVPAGTYIRPAGSDFKNSDVLLHQNTILSESTLSLAAAMNHPVLPLRRKPRVAIIATGDELLPPGSTPGPAQIIASNGYGVAEIVSKAGGLPIDPGIAKDTLSALEEKFTATEDADIVLTLGGASVGDHDLVHQALKTRGVELDFWKLAMRPGKPVMFGKSGHGASGDGGNPTRYIGLPGNPVSSLVCALIFVVPLIRKMLGLEAQTPKVPAKLAVALPANDQREEYMRATLEQRNGEFYVTPFSRQDSSLLSLMARADCLLIRPAFAPEQSEGTTCQIILL